MKLAIVLIICALILGSVLGYFTYALTYAPTTSTITITSTVLSTATVSKEHYPLVIVDVLSRNITLESKPSKIVSLSPSITEIIFALKLEKYLVGVDSLSNYPLKVNELKSKGVIEDVGAFWSPDLEKIVSLSPDLVIADADAHLKFKDKFDEVGLKVVYVKGGAATTVEDIMLDIMLIARIFNVEDEGVKLILELNRQLNSIKETLAGVKKTKILILLGPPSLGLWTVGSGKFLNDIIGKAGGENIAAKYFGWIQLSMEEVINANPEVIVVLLMGTAKEAEEIINEIMSSDLAVTSAVRNGKVYVLIGEADDIMSRPGPRVAEAVKILAQLLHPDIFGLPERPDIVSLSKP